MSDSTYPITGINDGFGPAPDQVPLRREIDELWASKDAVDVNQRSLFMSALKYFQEMNPADRLSYFQICGIHGQPLIPWDENTKPVEPGRGYCTHDSVLFGTWHRPYLLLFEQRLHEIMMQQIIPEFAPSEQDELKLAARTWRLPYWDWAQRKPDWTAPTDLLKYGYNVPYVITLEIVEIRTPTGTSTIPNPLWKFSMPGVGATESKMGDYGITEIQDYHFEQCLATSKQPPTFDPNDKDYVSDWVDGDVQNWQAITGNLRGTVERQANGLAEAVYRLFTEEYFSRYDAFISTRYQPFPPGVRGPPRALEFLSLEGIHNNIHEWVGGNGHMSQVPVAAFDPIFWLHHCNVDRLFAIWQELFPNKWFEEDPQMDSERGDSGTWSNKINDIDTPQTALGPFHTDEQAHYWNSEQARHTTALGYTYPELQRWLPEHNTSGLFNEEVYMNAIKAQLNGLYSTTAKLFIGQPTALLNVAAHPLDHTGNVVERSLFVQPKGEVQKHLDKITKVISHANDTAHDPSNTPAGSGKQEVEKNDYIVNVLYEKFALEGKPFTVHIFLGDVPAQLPYNFAEHPTQVGSVYNFSVPSGLIGRDSQGCDNCIKQQRAHVKSTGQVIITDTLVEHIRSGIRDQGMQLRSLGKEDVVEYLKTNLHWRVTTRRDRLVAMEDIPSLEVSVAMGKATHFAERSQLSQYRSYEVLHEITADRAGGAHQ